MASAEVIVAEDNPIQLAYMESLLKRLGYAAIPAKDGSEALNLVKSTNVQVLISDYCMPVMDGIRLTREIRALELDRYTHIIMVTANDDGDIRAKALDAGVDDFLPKGANLVSLKARLTTASRLVNHETEIAERNKVLQLANARIQSDLNAAADAQRKLLPCLKDLILGFGVSNAFVPSSFVSGDMFNCFALNEEWLAFYAIDVAGHGVHASLLSVAIGHLITPEFFRERVLADRPDPAALVIELNRRFASDDSDDYFVMFCAVVSRRTGELHFCQAGYPAPLLVDGVGHVTPIGSGGFPVGLITQADFANSTCHFPKGSRLVVYSDAAVEAESPESKPFGEGRLIRLISQMHGLGNADLPPAIVDELLRWRGQPSLEDDLTIVTIERNS